MIAHSILDLFGNTPMVKWRPRRSNWDLYLKLEKYNPGQSIKDRAALNMVLDAEANGRLKPGGTIIEASSGNTAIGLAIIAAIRGYRFVAVLDPYVPSEKVNLIRAYGAEIVNFDPPATMDLGAALIQRETYASELSKRTPNSIYVDQHNNPANTAAYPATLARELIEAVPDADLLFGAIGTSGSICGTSKGLREAGHKCKVIAVEPRGSVFFSSEGGPYFQSGSGNPPGIELPRILDRTLIDEGLQVTDVEAFSMCRALARCCGILLGGSAGGVLFKAYKYIEPMKREGKAVVIAADGGEKYMSTIFNDEWMRENSLLDHELEKSIAEWFS